MCDLVHVGLTTASLLQSYANRDMTPVDDVAKDKNGILSQT